MNLEQKNPKSEKGTPGFYSRLANLDCEFMLHTKGKKVKSVYELSGPSDHRLTPATCSMKRLRTFYSRMLVHCKVPSPPPPNIIITGTSL